MSREIRRVPPDWEHPRDALGRYKPLIDRDYETALQEWWEGRQKWQRNPESDCTWEEWEGSAPNPDYHRPAWSAEEATCFQVYENVSEGTPTSPVFATERELLAWLLSEGFSEHAAVKFVEHKWAPSMVINVGVDGRTQLSGLGIHAWDMLGKKEGDDNE